VADVNIVKYNFAPRAEGPSMRSQFVRGLKGRNTGTQLQSQKFLALFARPSDDTKGVEELSLNPFNPSLSRAARRLTRHPVRHSLGDGGSEASIFNQRNPKERGSDQSLKTVSRHGN